MEKKDSSVENLSAIMLKKFPNSENIHHAAVQSDVTSLKVVPKSGKSLKKNK